MHRAFAGKGFRMGWFQREGGQGPVYRVGVAEAYDGSTAFLGAKGEVKELATPSKRYPGERTKHAALCD